MTPDSRTTRARTIDRLARVGVFCVAALAALSMGRPAARYASRPFDRLAAPALAADAAASGDAFGRSGGVRLRLALPGDSVEFPLGVSGDPDGLRYRWVRAADGEATSAERPLAGAWLVAPTHPGFHRLALVGADGRVEVIAEPALGVMVPFEAKRGGMVGRYRIGTYVGERLGLGARPEGFLPVDSTDLSLAVSRHLRLAEFVTRDAQRDVWPKYVALSPRLLDKLELVIAEVERARGQSHGPTVAPSVKSGFRTPAHNGGVQRAARDSRHQYGDAADVAIDADGDGRLTARDGRLVARAVEAVEREHPDLAGGLGLYTSGRYRTPYVHIDARGQSVRWRG